MFVLFGFFGGEGVVIFRDALLNFCFFFFFAPLHSTAQLTSNGIKKHKTVLDSARLWRGLQVSYQVKKCVLKYVTRCPLRLTTVEKEVALLLPTSLAPARPFFFSLQTTLRRRG